MTSFDIIVINLDDSTNRLKSVSNMLDREKVKWRRISAVDGRNGMPKGDYIYDNRASLIRHDRPMSGGEVGCFLSHLAALRLFLAGNCKHAVILEDDIEITSGVFTKLNDITKQLDKRFGKRWDTFNFSASVKGYQFKEFSVGDIDIMRSTYMPCGLKGQLWSRPGAEAYLKSRFATVLMGPVDREMRSHFARRGRSFIPRNPMTNVADFESDIDAKENRWLTSGKQTKTTLRCKVMRHFPDYLNAYVNLKKLQLGLAK